jgi:hypothetical protein
MVLFCGTGREGCTVADFSVAAPGAQVVAFRPYATLDPCKAGWDHRHVKARRRDWTLRYGYALAMLEAGDRALVLHDRALTPDVMHASLFGGPQVTSLRAPFTKQGTDATLHGMGLRLLLLDLAIEGRLDAHGSAPFGRRRRDYLPYLHALLQRCRAREHSCLAARVCRWRLRTAYCAAFAQRLAPSGDPAAAAQAAQ